MSTKLEERIAEIKAMDYSDEWKENQIAGAILSQEGRDSIRGKDNYLAGEHEVTPWPSAQPYDLPKEVIEDKDYE